MSIITLPKYDDMVARLDSVDNDSYTKERFHPLILKDAGRELAAADVVLKLELAIHDFAASSGRMTGVLMRMRIKDYITAIVDDDVVRDEALNLVDDTNAAMKKRFDEQPPAPPRVELSDDD